MIRFFAEPAQIRDGVVTLNADDAYHLRTVLKASLGDSLHILDGSGWEWAATLEVLTKSRAEARLGTAWEPNTEPHTQITVAQALPKVTDKMEQVLQRGTEIGVSHFLVFECERSLTHLTGERQVKRLIRWQEIIKTAAEQAHRSRLPSVHVAGHLRDLLSAPSACDLVLIAHPTKVTHTLRQSLSEKPQSILLLIGPEAGFTDAEVQGAQSKGAQSIYLGPRVLRTETAALAAVSQILFALEPDDVR